MNKFWAVFKREYMERVRTGWFIAATIFGPVLISCVLFLPAYFSRGASAVAVNVPPVLVIDGTSTGIGAAIATDLSGGISGSPDRVRLTTVLPDSMADAEAQATRSVIARELQGYLAVVPNASGVPSVRYAGRDAASILDMERLRVLALRHVVADRMSKAGVEPELAMRIAQTQMRFTTERISGQGRGGSGGLSLVFSISVGMLLYLTILMYGQNVLRGVLDEKQTRVAEMVVAGMSPELLLGGKVFGIGAVGLTQVLIWSSTSVLMLRFRGAFLTLLGAEARPLQLPPIALSTGVLLLVFFLFGFLLYAALFASVGAMVSSEQEAQQAQIPVVMLLVVSIMFLQPVLASPDSPLAVTLSYIPFSAPVVMPLRMSAVSVPWWEIALSLIALISAGYLALFVAARIYRTGVLLTGKRPSLREVARWVRHR